MDDRITVTRGGGGPAEVTLDDADGRFTPEEPLRPVEFPLAEAVRRDPRSGTCRCGARGYIAVALADPVYRYCTRCGSDWWSDDGVTIDA